MTDYEHNAEVPGRIQNRAYSSKPIRALKHIIGGVPPSNHVKDEDKNREERHRPLLTRLPCGCS